MNLIALADQNWGIARAGRQVCHIPDDLRRFRELTLGGTVIMGRKTYETIGHPLEGRRNLVLSRNEGFSPPGVAVFEELEDILALMDGAMDAWVIGGESIYRQLLPYCDKAYITLVHDDLGADQFAPNLSESGDWLLTDRTRPRRYKHLLYQYLWYQRCGEEPIVNPYNPGTIMWEVMQGSLDRWPQGGWADLTIEEIAAVLGRKEPSVRGAIRKIKLETGYCIPHAYVRRGDSDER